MAVLTIKNYVNNLNNFFNDILSSGDAYYFFVGKSLAWPNDSLPPLAVNDYEEFEQSIYHDIVFGKQITNNNIAFLIPNYQWANNTVYAQYDPNDPNLFSKQFYVVNKTYSVYKCIDNNGGANSTIQPQTTSTSGTFQTADGYTWKYMYTVPSNANTTFTSNSFIPVVPNTYVTTNSLPGTVDIIRVAASGSGYEGYNEGFLLNVLSPEVVKIANTAVSIDNFYTGSSIYLKAGLGADQIRQIVGYNGGTQTVSVSPAFNTYVNLYLGPDLTGNFILGQTVIQEIVNVSYLFPQGYFNSGDVLVQSDSGAVGIATTSNSTTIAINQTSNNGFSIISGKYPVIDTTYAGVIQTGTVSVNATSNVITANTANLLNYSVNQYIQVGGNSNTNVRRIASITNSSVATVSVPFNNTLNSNVHYNVPYAFEPISATTINSNGEIIQVNLTSIIISYGNTTSNTISFIPGETVKEYNNLNIDQNANAIVSFVNSTAMVLSNVNGTLTSGFFLVGQSSSLQGQITQINSYPNVTLSGSLGTFVAGSKVYSYYANSSMSGNATLLSYSTSPSSTTEYIISPTVNITGDGFGALAYSTVNTAIGNNYAISDVVMINTGQQYTVANVTITANTQWGNGAIINPVLSPAEGHGANTYTELGSRYGGISVTFDTATNENYYYPSYGTYRRVGIIKNPLFNSLTINTDNVHRYFMTTQVLSANSFANGEIIYQYSTSAAAKVVMANSTYMEIDSVNGIFASNASNSSSNNMIVGLSSGAKANVVVTNTHNFSIVTNNQVIIQSNGNATGYLADVVTNNQIILTNVSGKFTSNVSIHDPITNAYANVLSLYTVNGSVNSTATFGMKFNQTCRVTITSNSTTSFVVGEYVNQATSNASGLILDTTHEIDMFYAPNNGVMTTGITITDANTSATGIITFANSSYLRITGANGSFRAGDSISTITANGNVEVVFPCLVITDLFNQYPFQTGVFTITGNTSGAQGIPNLANTILYPDLVRNTGDVIYVNDISPFTLSLPSKETFSLVVQM